MNKKEKILLDVGYSSGEEKTIKEKKSYYDIQLDALNSIERLKDKKEYIKKIDFTQLIEKDSDAQTIADINKFKDFLDEGILKEVDEGKKSDEILNLLDEEELTYQYLDLGEINGEGYVGFKLNNQESIMTSAGDIYRNTEIRTREGIFGENQIKKLFNYQGYIGEIAPVIKNKTIKKYYTQVHRNHLVNSKELYKEIRDKILFYMDFAGKDEIADVLTCWILATYFYPLFYWFPHILFNAPSMSGKSKGAYIMTKLSFRGFDLGVSGGVTPPQIFRTIEGNRGTILLDEYEQSKGKVTAETQQLVNQILNASASRDAYIIRVEQVNGKWIAKKFSIFCPKISCNISGINPTSLSRFIGFSWLKTKTEKGKRKPQKDKEFEEIQQNLYLFLLENWKNIKEIYENLDVSLTNRDEDNWLPLYTIAKFIDNQEGENLGVTGQLNKYLDSYKDLQIETGDPIEDFFYILLDKVEDEQRYYTPKEIGEWEQTRDLLSWLKSPANWVGRTLKAYKFLSSRGGGLKRYMLSKELVKNIIDLYFKKETTPNTTIDTKQHKQHQTTPKIDEKDKNVVLCGVSVVLNEGGVDEKLSKFTDSEIKSSEEDLTPEEFDEKYKIELSEVLEDD